MLSREYPDLFIAFGSVNPYRHDAIQRLQHLSELGVNVIKWLVCKKVYYYYYYYYY